MMWGAYQSGEHDFLVVLSLILGVDRKVAWVECAKAAWTEEIMRRKKKVFVFADLREFLRSVVESTCCSVKQK